MAKPPIKKQTKSGAVPSSSEQSHARASGKSIIRQPVFLFLTLWAAALIVAVLFATVGHALLRAHFHSQPESYRARCAEMLKAGNFSAAELEANRAIKRDKYDFDARFLLAESYSRRGMNDAAYAELGGMEKLVQNIIGVRRQNTGYDLGRALYLMGMMDFKAGRFEQGTANLLRTIDEAPDYISGPPAGFTSIDTFIQNRFNESTNVQEQLALCRLLDAVGKQVPARQKLASIGATNPGVSEIARLLGAELNMFAWWSTPSDTDLTLLVAGVKEQLQNILASRPDYLGRLWAMLLLGSDGKPTAPIKEDVFLQLLGNQPAKVILPQDFHVISPTPANAASGWVRSFDLHHNGKVGSDFTLDKPTRELWVVARGSSAMRAWPYAIVRLDGREIGRIYVRLDAYRPYIIPVSVAAGKHTVEFEFLNAEWEKSYKNRLKHLFPRPSLDALRNLSFSL